MATQDRVDNQALLAALNHRLRRTIMREMSDAVAVSPRDLAERLDEPLGNLSYHMRVLADCGALTLVREEPVRGTTRHFYRASTIKGWAELMLRETEGESSNGDS